MSLSILISVTHLLGVGHLTRAAALGRGLADAGHRVTLASGGNPAPLVATGGITFVQLPPVHCRGLDFATLLGEDGQPIDTEIRAQRIDRLVEALVQASPDVVITETFPFGRRQLAAEFLALVETASARVPRPAILASVRDILNPPSRPARVDEASGTLGRFYDGVLVHGDENLAPLAASWPVDAGLESRLIYTGYVFEKTTELHAPNEPEEGGVLVSGGGSAASLPLFRAAIAAAQRCPQAVPWRLLVGHAVAEADFAALQAEAAAATTGPDVVVERARRDFRTLLATCAVSVSQAGYNTVTDLVESGARAVLVPFERGSEAEQRLRAERFAARGLAGLVTEADLTPERLAKAVGTALLRPRPDRIDIDLDGIAGSVKAVEDLAARRGAIEAAWQRLDDLLDRLASKGSTVTVWWRDDDATAPGAALDRLLDLARRHGAPVALAVIPDLATPDLADRTAIEPSACVLVHGCRHANHAPVGAKKQELGFRDPSVLAEALAASRHRTASLFGGQAVPVLVPPWNRIDPALVERLADLGFIGLSTFGGPRATGPGGLAIVDTHHDPIDWKRGGGLVEEAGLLDRLAATLDRAAMEDGRFGPVGILTHHLVHDAYIWSHLDRLLLHLARSPAIAFVDIRDALARRRGILP